MYYKRVKYMMLFLLFFVTPIYGQDNNYGPIRQEPQINWHYGPTVAKMENIAGIKVPDGYVFTNGEDTRTIMSSMGNPPSNKEIGMFAPKTLEWFAIFEFNDIGYVRDDEKDSLNADAILQSISRSTEESNKIRRGQGFPEIHVVGWETLPHYNEKTHNLEWAIRAKDDEEVIGVNHNTRILGRRGVMSVTFVGDVNEINTTLPLFKEHMKGFAYQTSQKYGEYKKGDKIAQYGLTALIVGGTAAAAVKTGLAKWLWKLIIPAVIGIGAFLKRMFMGGKPIRFDDE